MARSKHLQNKSGIFWYLCRSNLALFLVRVHIYIMLLITLLTGVYISYKLLK